MNKILFITSRFPYGSEEAFIENEIIYLSEAFKEVYILPVHYKPTLNISKDRVSILPSNVKVLEFKESNDFAIKSYIKPLAAELSHFKTAKKLLDFKSLKIFLATLKNNLKLKSAYDKVLAENNLENSVAYSYWAGPWLTSILLLKNKYKLKVVARAHGFDLYNEIHPNNYYPLKPFLLKNLTGLYPISKLGIDYLHENYKFFNGTDSFYLGIKPHSKTNRLVEGAIFRIVSCSNMIPLKQIHKLIEALKLCTFPIQWEHFGDGILRAELEALANELPSNVTYTFHGHIPNVKVHEFYNSNPTNLFINVSNSEGIPVSIMEAMSYGIPVIATNVGATNEVVKLPFGQLLDDNFSNLELAEKINAFNDKSSNEIEIIRKEAQEFIWNTFNADNNYKKYFSFLANL